MLIPKKMSFKKILQYGLIMSLTLGSTGYLILKNFIAPDFFNKNDDGAPVIIIPPLSGAVSGSGDVPSSGNKDKGLIFDDEKFKNLRDNMSADLDSPETIKGKKNPFEPLRQEPEKTVEQTEQPIEPPTEQAVSPIDPLVESSEPVQEVPSTTSEQQFISL